MEFTSPGCGSAGELTELFRTSFTASEGEAEGEAIATLVSRLSRAIDAERVCCFGAVEDHVLVAAIFFTELVFAADVRVFMLAPVAVLPSCQRRGIGQALIRFGLDAMQQRGVEIAVTYGDPAFYGRVGFLPLPESILRAPMPLSMPQGWLGQSLTGKPIPTLFDRPTCVPAFDNPHYW
jgi:putative acetyltransferase